MMGKDNDDAFAGVLIALLIIAALAGAFGPSGAP